MPSPPRPTRKEDCILFDFNSIDEFDQFKALIESQDCVDFFVARTRNLSYQRDREVIYRCGRHGNYSESLKSDSRLRKMKKETKKIGFCPCRMTLNTFKNKPSCKVYYYPFHSHEIGLENVASTRVSSQFRAQIAEMFVIK